MLFGETGFNPHKVMSTEYIREEHKKISPEAYNNNSILDGVGNKIGWVLEELLQVFRPDLTRENTFNHDFVTPYGTVDAKAKWVNKGGWPREDWAATVYDTSKHQTADYYIFGRVYVKIDNLGENYFPYGYICGGILREEFHDIGTHYNRGDREGDNGYKITDPCTNVRLDQLRPIAELEGNIVSPEKEENEEENWIAENL